MEFSFVTAISDAPSQEIDQIESVDTALEPSFWETSPQHSRRTTPVQDEVAIPLEPYLSCWYLNCDKTYTITVIFNIMNKVLNIFLLIDKFVLF